jgi:hypothetical protein
VKSISLGLSEVEWMVRGEAEWMLQFDLQARTSYAQGLTSLTVIGIIIRSQRFA